MCGFNATKGQKPMSMTFDDVEREFTVSPQIYPTNKRRRVCSIKAKTDRGTVIFRVLISRSPKGNPVLTIKTMKPMKGEFKIKSLMGCPREIVQPRRTAGEKKAKRRIGVDVQSGRGDS